MFSVWHHETHVTLSILFCLLWSTNVLYQSWCLKLLSSLLSRFDNYTWINNILGLSSRTSLSFDQYEFLYPTLHFLSSLVFGQIFDTFQLLFQPLENGNNKVSFRELLWSSGKNEFVKYLHRKKAGDTLWVKCKMNKPSLATYMAL